VVEGVVAVDGAPLVVELVPSAGIAAGEARHDLGQILQRVRPETQVIRIATPPPGAEPSPVSLDERPLVLVVRDPERHAWQRALAAELIEAAGTAVVVDVGLPAWRPQGAAGRLVTYGAGRVNLEAAVERLVGSS
jgi:beta-N-acetylhexosaminidase